MLVCAAGGGRADLRRLPFDKFQARRQGVRIPEDALLILTLAGGVIGSTLAMLLLRHKTQHKRFWLTQAAAAIISVASGLPPAASNSVEPGRRREDA